MEKPSPVIFSITTILLSQASNCYDKYGKYAKWTVFGLLTLCGLNYLMDWYINGEKGSPPADASSSPVDPPEANPSSSGSLPVAALPASGLPNFKPPSRPPPRRPKIFNGLDGPVEFPTLDDRESLAHYVTKHSLLGRKHLEEKNFDLATYHSSLLLFIHPDPMAYFETNSGYMPKDTYDLAKISLAKVLEMVEDQMKNEEPAPLS